MANKRRLKKIVASICEDLMIECMAAKQDNVSEADIENIAKTIVLMQLDFTNRLSHIDKHQVKRFFVQYEEDLAVTTNEIVDAICHLN